MSPAVTPGGAGAAERAAVIDVGSNSALLLAVTVRPDGRARATDEALATTRLGAGLMAGGPLDPADRARAGRAVAALAGRARGAGVTRLWLFATGAVRDAADGAACAAELAAIAAAPVEILTGEREATLAYAAVAHALAAGERPLLAADAGGRTTELALGRGERVEETASLAVGALALTRTLGWSGQSAADRVAALAAEFAAAPLVARARAEGASLVASGGTATALAALALGLPRYEPRRVHGHVLAAATVAAFGEGMAAASPAALAGLDPGRAEILPAGAMLLCGLLEAMGAGGVTVSDHGVRHGYLRERLGAVGVAADMRELWA